METKPIDREISLKSFQDGFYTSLARFPGFLSAWGTGKTMVAILKGITLSSVYLNNLGLIVRKKFTDLRDSTLKDFERYTGLSVPMSTKEMTIPGTDSVIMFRHGDELSGLQNVNLGWVYIEQAEEFESSEQFDMLRGRLRRELRVNEFYESNIPEYEEFIRNLKEHPLRQLMVGANAAGHNWVWHRWVHARREGYELFEARTFDNAENLPKDFIDDLLDLKKDNIKKYNRYVENSHEDYDMEGAYFASIMSDLLKAGRVGVESLYDPEAGVYTFWDLGLRASDTTVIWCVQFIRDEIRMIDYCEDYGKGMDFYNDWLNSKTYNWIEHWLPPDAVQRIQGRKVTTRYDILKNYRTAKHERVCLVSRHHVIDRIDVSRRLLPKCKFDVKCSLGVDSLNHYRTVPKDKMSLEDRLKMQAKPLDNWATNGADAFGYMAWVYREQLVIDNRRIGLPYPLRQNSVPKHPLQEIIESEEREERRKMALTASCRRGWNVLDGLR